MSAASDAAALASLMPADSRTAQLARMRLDVAVREERNAMTRIYAPDERFTGGTTIGPNALSFDAGVAEVDLDTFTPGALSYMQSLGYGIDGPATPPAQAPHAVTLDGSPAADSRTIESPYNSVGQPRNPGVQ